MTEPTGERFLPQLGGKIALEHWHRYHLAAHLTAGKDVLDVACGEGYGSAYLAQNARLVVGMDIDAATVEEAHTRYTAPNLRFQTADCTALPLPDSSVDLIVSFETIEHHDQHEAMLREFCRVLRPDGQLLLSSPDRAIYSQQEGHQNPFHIRELDRTELLELLGRHFPHVQLWGQRAQTVSLIAQEAAKAPLAWESAPPAWEYLLALCARQPLPQNALPESLFCLPTDPLRALERAYLELESHYRNLETKFQTQAAAFQAREKEFQELRETLQATEQEFQQQQQAFQSHLEASQATEQAFQAREAEFQALELSQNELTERFLALEEEARRWYSDAQALALLRQSRTFRWAQRLAPGLREESLWQ